MTNTVTSEQLKSDPRRYRAITRTALDTAAGHYRFFDTVAGHEVVLRVGPPPESVALRHHPDCGDPAAEDTPITPGCVPDCPVRKAAAVDAVVARLEAAGPLLERRDALHAELVDIVIHRVEAILGEIIADPTGLVKFAGAWVERDAIAPALRELLTITPEQARHAHELLSARRSADIDASAFRAAFGTPTVVIGRKPPAPPTVTVTAPLRDDATVSICADLTAFIDGELDPARADRFREHVRQPPWCEQCRADLIEAAQVTGQLSTLRDSVTLEQVYPVTEPHLTRLRDTTASPFERIEAAQWLVMHGFDKHPLMRDDVRAAARGELPGSTPLQRATDVANRCATVCSELDAVIAEMEGTGEVLVPCQPTYDRIAERLAKRLPGQPVTITQDSVPSSPEERAKMRVKALGVEVVR